MGNYSAVLEQTEDLETVYPEAMLGAGAYGGTLEWQYRTPGFSRKISPQTLSKSL